MWGSPCHFLPDGVNYTAVGTRHNGFCCRDGEALLSLLLPFRDAASASRKDESSRGTKKKYFWSEKDVSCNRDDFWSEDHDEKEKEAHDDCGASSENGDVTMCGDEGKSV